MSELVERAQQAFRHCGMRLTPQRRTILDVLDESKSHLDAEAVILKARRRKRERKEGRSVERSSPTPSTSALRKELRELERRRDDLESGRDRPIRASAVPGRKPTRPRRRCRSRPLLSRLTSVRPRHRPRSHR